jgi:2-polyprenyl-3-methyl-5-hydroxy-6-metoxy-1,4-benzoquinol methylase
VPECLICDGTDFEQYAAGAYGRDIKLCRGCGLVVTDPRPDAAALNGHYDSEYYASWMMPEQRERRVRLWRRRVKVVKGVCPGGRLLDAGCGEGLFLHTANAAGYDGVGLEISEYAARYARERFGLDVRNASIEDAGFPEGSFDVITFWHVLEHLTSPLEALRKARALLKPGGRLLAAVPNVDDKLGQAFYKARNGKYFQIYTPGSREPHLYHFSTVTFRKLLEKAGFSVDRVTADFAQVDPYWRIIEWASFAASKLTGRDMYLAILAVGRK